MIIRFDSKKLQSNTVAGIGVEADPANTEKGAISEVEMIVGEAKRASIDANNAVAFDSDSEKLKQNVIRDIEEEDPEPGPELTPEGTKLADKVKAEKKSGTTQNG